MKMKHGRYRISFIKIYNNYKTIVYVCMWYDRWAHTVQLTAESLISLVSSGGHFNHGNILPKQGSAHQLAALAYPVAYV